MSIQKRKYFILNRFIIIAMIFISVTVIAQPEMHDKGRHKRDMIHAPFYNALSDSQKTELKEFIQTMKNEEVDPDSFRAAIHNKLASWNITLPDIPRFFDRFDNQLTEEQKTELHATIDSLKAYDASRREIRDAVKEKLDGWGIKPNRRDDREGFRRHRMFDNLTDQQQDAIHNLIQDMRESDATRQEIHEAVMDQLKTWGITLPERKDPDQNGQNQGSKQNKLRGSNRPNPFNPSTTISYELQAPADVMVTIYDTQGKTVRTFSQGYREAGQYQVHWDAKTDSDERLPSGTYIYKIQAGDQIFQGRMVLIK